ncbi:MAG: ABC transporter permease [Oscillospiraceae bacterium]
MLQPYIETFHKYKYLLQNLIVRDIKVKYRRSILGVAWSLLNPLLMMFILNAVFSRIFRFQIPNFPLYLITGQILFGFFNEATSAAIFSIVDASSLIKKVYIPKYMFPIEKVLFGFVNLVFSIPAIAVMMLMFRVPFSPVMFMCVFPLISMLMFTLGFSLVISALCVFFRDLKHLYSVLITAWMYLTPIIYPLSELEGSWIYYIALLNPLTWYVEYFRQTLIYATMPTAVMNCMCFGYGALFIIVGLLMFKKLQDKFILYI